MFYNNDDARAGTAYYVRSGWYVRDVCGESLVVPVGGAEMAARQMAVLNGTGRFLWDKLSVPTTKHELCQALIDEYDVTADEAARDVDEFIGELIKYKYIEEKKEKTR